MSRGLGKTQAEVLRIAREGKRWDNCVYVDLIHSIAKLHGFSRPSVSRAITSLCKRGYLERCRHNMVKVLSVNSDQN